MKIRILWHVALSACLAAVLYIYFDFIPALGAFLSGVVLDIDHFVDWLLWSKSHSLRSLLVIGTWFVKPHVTDYFLHSYELLFFVWLLVWHFNAYPIGIAITLGYASHLLSDQVYNRMRFGADPMNNFLIYKVIRFEKRVALYARRMALYDLVLQRDNLRCQVCGDTGNPKLEVHMEKYAYGDQESPDQFITVCPRCHTKKHVFFWNLLETFGFRIDH